MQKTDIDYSNTVFYKIVCKDVSVRDVYIGHTINFVQRKHAHRRSCNKANDQSHNYKVYRIIREHGGWENWNMEMIGFKNCKNHSEACTTEQEYFDSYKASLNSILAKKQTVERLPKIVNKKLDLYCEVCDISCKSIDSFERHKKTKKHESSLNALDKTIDMITNVDVKKFICKACHFECSKRSDYNRHLATPKHVKMTKITEKKNNSSVRKCGFICACGKTYAYRQGLHKHQKVCNQIINDNKSVVVDSQPEALSSQLSNDVVMALIKDNDQLRIQLKNQQEEQTRTISQILEKLETLSK